jgi:serine/threonine protein kinase
MAKLPSCEDYEISIDTAPLIKAPILQGGYVEKVNDVIIRYVGGFCIVFPYYTTSKKIAVRCWIANVAHAQQRSKLIAEYLHEKKLPYFVNFDYIENALATNDGMQPIVVMDWVNADTLKEFLEKHINNQKDLLLLADKFKEMVAILHENNISHGDLQHGNIMVQPNGDLTLVDYDSLYVPTLEGYPDDIKGLLGYQHPARMKSKNISNKNDYFSELIIYTSIVALAYYPQLWHEKQIAQTETLLFSADDIEQKGRSAIFSLLSNDKKSAGLLPNLSAAIKKELAKTSIDELLPLELAIISPSDKIRNKWNKKTETQPKEPYTPNTDITRERWNAKKEIPQYEVNIETESIAKKWQ